MSEPTPGRWGIFENGNEEEAVIVSYGDTARDIAYLKRENDQEWPEVEANAYLIAAAPALRDALLSLSTNDPDCDPCWCSDEWRSPSWVAHREHSPACLDARVALAASAPPPTADAGAEDGA